MSRRSSRQRRITVDVDAAETTSERAFPWPWYAVAVIGPWLVLLIGWLLAAGPSMLGWLTSPNSQLNDVIGLASILLLSANGAQVVIGGTPISVMPLGLTIALVLLLQPVASLAARQAARGEALADDTGQLWVNGERLVFRVTGTVVGSYLAGLLLLATLVPVVDWSVLAKGLIIAAVATAWGASREVGFDPTRNWIPWLRQVPVAVGTALLVILVAGAAAVAATFILRFDQLVAVHGSLQPDALGSVLLAYLQLLYLPNLIIWGGSWAVGAGLSIGDGSFLSLGVSDLGFLPAIPMLSAVPPSGLLPAATRWWLLTGVAAGALAGAVVTLARPRARFDQTALVGGLTGMLAGLAAAVMAAFASGGLGSQRLAYVGVRVGDMLVVGPSLLGLAGLVTGLVIGLLRRPQSAPEPDAETADAAEVTEQSKVEP